jgi:hypothetical protein
MRIASFIPTFLFREREINRGREMAKLHPGSLRAIAFFILAATFASAFAVDSKAVSTPFRYETYVDSPMPGAWRGENAGNNRNSANSKNQKLKQPATFVLNLKFR